MPIITSKTDEAIRNEFNRRGFMKLAGSAGFGLILHSQVGYVSLAMGAPSMAVPPGFRDFLKYFGDFALNIGMRQLGLNVSQFLPRYPKVQQSFNTFLGGVNGYSPYTNFDVLGGYAMSFLPVRNPNNSLYMLPFFNQSSGNLGSGIQWFSGAALPQVNEEIRDVDHISTAGRAQFLVPIQPRGNKYNDMKFPERYTTSAGSTEFQYKGDARSGEVEYTIWRKKSRGTLEEPAKSGEIGVSLQA